MQFKHTPARIAASFDDPNLVSAAGVVPVMRLAEDAGLSRLAGEHVTVPGDKGANAVRARRRPIHPEPARDAP